MKLSGCLRLLCVMGAILVGWAAGMDAEELHGKVAAVEIVDPLTVRFRLKEPWPDFMTFYGTNATAAGLIVPQ